MFRLLFAAQTPPINAKAIAIMDALLDACGDAVEENLPECGYVIILATSASGSTPGDVMYTSNITDRQARDTLMQGIIDSPEKPDEPDKPITH